jgi:hypothetical protein
MMNRKQALELIASELEAAEGLPPNAAQHIADIRADKNVGPGIESMIRAVLKAAEGAGQ